jgi:predicted metal-dependent phosphoesterase TrpH
VDQQPAARDQVKIDLHVHARERSYCAHSSEQRLIEAAIAAGLDALVLTDHDRLVPREHLAELNARYAPFRLFGGIEVSTESEHVLVLGVCHPVLECKDWSYADLQTFVKKQGGFLAIAHPFRWGNLDADLEEHPPDALEVHTRNTPGWAEARIRDLAARHDLVLLCNTDAHHARQLGEYYNVLLGDPADEAELLRLLRRGPVACAHPESH